MFTYVSVGRTTVGAFTSQQAVFRCIRQIAPGCKPKIKKCHHTGGDVMAKYRSNEVRPKINRGIVTGIETYNPVTGTRKKIRYLFPGEFKL